MAGRLNRREGSRLLPGDMASKLRQLDTEFPGEYACVFYEGVNEDGEAIFTDTGEPFSSLERRDPGRYAILKLETSKILHECFIDERGERRTRLRSGGVATHDATMARATTFLSEAWTQNSLDQREQIRELKAEVKELRVERDALKDELAEALAGDSDMGELIALGKEFFKLWKGNSFGSDFKDIANEVLPRIVEIVGPEKAAQIAQLLVNAVQSRGLELSA